MDARRSEMVAETERHRAGGLRRRATAVNERASGFATAIVPVCSRSDSPAGAEGGWAR